ncbi:hypothetical protein JCM31826_00130 [Thermaurantimonas aggregans]|uniref:Uncharacterized protein n=2 Tax=Thermaurantimonas aggregans TaxID=2173829 RepID=A0A401XHP2_9FLAO|nr:hypothetical protein JCM31826_00130 [Thermaurantimonas aggregans]
MSCKVKKLNPTETLSESAPESIEKPACTPMVIKPFQAVEDSLKVQVATPLEVIQDGLCVRIRFQYSGCSEGNAFLVWNGVVLKSYPPQAHLVLYADDTGPCDRLIDGFGEFDLSELRHFSDSLVILRIREYPERIRIKVRDF